MPDIALGDVTSGFAAFRPPKRVTVAQGIAETLVVHTPGGYVGPWSPDETPYMVEPVNTLSSRHHEAVCFVGPARTGKACDVATPIPTPSGWTTMGELRVGDTVFAPDGSPTAVVFATEYQYGRPCFEVKFSDGEVIVADADHRWGVERFYWKEPTWRYEVRTTAEMLDDLYYGHKKDGSCRFRYRVRNTTPLQMPYANLSIDPYLLGVWLGNGDKCHSSVSTWCVDSDHYAAEFALWGHSVHRAVDKEGSTDRLVIDRVGEATYRTFRRQLADLELLNNKHIPPAYLRASEHQRWLLLQGLMDTDGYADDRQASVEFSTVIARLKDDFLELARSLGLKPIAKFRETTWTHNGERRFGTAWRITFPRPEGVRLFRLPRKHDASNEAGIDVGFRQIVSITPVESRPVKCIQVDHPSHLFLCGRGFIPTHNTIGLINGWMCHNVVNDPGDMLIINMTQDKAREMSKTDIDRAIRHSPKVGEMLGSTQDDNTHDKMFRNGMWLRIAWPTVSNVSGSTYRYTAATDYDRIPDDIDGEGSLYGLLLKRTQTFLSRGMTLVESSPGRPLTDPHWRPATPHEAPPTNGILGIYNRSDRRRFYWQCPDCDEFFEAEPGLKLFGLPDEDTLLEIVRTLDIHEFAKKHNRIICPHCGSLIGPRSKHNLNKAGLWVPDGQTVTSKREFVGATPHSPIAGFWLGGTAAAYQSWMSIISRYLMGLREYALSGSELTLQNTVNTDQGCAYMPRAIKANASAHGSPEGRRDNTLERFIVPDEARFLVAAVDVQGGQRARFVVQVHAVGEHLEQWPIDRFSITESVRKGEDGENLPIDPAAFPEDWDRLTEMVVRSTYRLTEEGREIRIRKILVDSGGEDGVTDKAYEWYRRLRREGEHVRVTLIKGASTKTAPVIKESLVGGKSPKDKGDIPLYLLNPNLLKDAVHNAFSRETPGPGYMHIPAWLPNTWFDELNAEIRNPDGTWKKIKKHNETFDLCGYIRAGIIMLGADKFDWEHAPGWARPMPENADVISREERRRLQGDAPPARTRRVSRSSYLSGR